MLSILVTPRSVTRDGHPSFNKIRSSGYEVITCTPGAQPSEDELKTLLPGCIGYLAGVEPITESVINSAKDLRVISRNGTGIDNIDLESAQKANIIILRAEGANAPGVAELTIGLLFSLARSIPFSDHCLKSGGWERRKGFEIAGKTLGLIGFGKIGQMVGSMASRVGMKVVAYDPYQNREQTKSSPIRMSSLNEVLNESDVISMHCPSQPGKKPIIDSGAVDRMKKGVYLINTARADLLDINSVITGIESGKILGLAVDVYDQEPPLRREFIEHDCVISTPHIGGFTKESVDRAMNEAVDNLLKALAELA